MLTNTLFTGIGLIILVSMSLFYNQLKGDPKSFNRIAIANSVENQENSSFRINSDQIVRISQLIAKEEINSPTGGIYHSDRDIGFISIFLNLENHHTVSQNVEIQNVEIYNGSSQPLRSFVFEPRAVTLNPLEHSQLVFHLSNKTGFSEQEQVKAIVLYKVQEQNYTIESELVQVKKY